MREVADRRLNAVQNFLIAGTAATAGRLFVHPFSVMKIYGEVGVPGGKMGMSQTYRWIRRLDGYGGFARGGPLAAARIFPHVGIQFAVFDKLSAEFVRKPQNKSTTESYFFTYLCGAVAGAVAQLITHPLDALKTQTVVKQAQGAALFNLYRGLPISVIGAASFSGDLFLFWDFVDNLPWRRRGAEPFVYLEWLLLPAAAWSAAAFANHPFDVIRRKMMVPHGGADVKFGNVFECAWRVYKLSGVFGFWHGFLSNAMKTVPQLAVFWFTFKGLQQISTSSERRAAPAQL